MVKDYVIQVYAAAYPPKELIMATWPANGDTDWNTKMLAYLAIEHEADGSHKIQTILTDAEGQFVYANLDGSPTKIYTKYFTGTMDGDSSTSVAHGITGVDKILSVAASVFSTNDSTYRFSEIFNSASATIALTGKYDATNVILDGIGSTLQSQKYRIKVEYIL